MTWRRLTIATVRRIAHTAAPEAISEIAASWDAPAKTRPDMSTMSNGCMPAPTALTPVISPNGPAPRSMGRTSRRPSRNARRCGGTQGNLTRLAPPRPRVLTCDVLWADPRPLPSSEPTPATSRAARRRRHAARLRSNRQEDEVATDEHPQGLGQAQGRRRPQAGGRPQPHGQAEPPEEDDLGRRQAAARVAERQGDPPARPHGLRQPQQAEPALSRGGRRRFARRPPSPPALSERPPGRLRRAFS